MNSTTLTIEWLKNKLGKKFYPVTHATAVARGNSTVDKDLTELEDSVSEINTYIKTTGMLASKSDVRQLAEDIIKNSDGKEIDWDEYRAEHSDARLATDEEVNSIKDEVEQILSD